MWDDSFYWLVFIQFLFFKVFIFSFCELNWCVWAREWVCTCVCSHVCAHACEYVCQTLTWNSKDNFLLSSEESVLSSPRVGPRDGSQVIRAQRQASVHAEPPHQNYGTFLGKWILLLHHNILKVKHHFKLPQGKSQIFCVFYLNQSTLRESSVNYIPVK
jgi:hypothetical protein